MYIEPTSLGQATIRCYDCRDGAYIPTLSVKAINDNCLRVMPHSWGENKIQIRAKEGNISLFVMNDKFALSDIPEYWKDAKIIYGSINQ